MTTWGLPPPGSSRAKLDRFLPITITTLQTSGASLRRTAEGGSPHVVIGPASRSLSCVRSRLRPAEFLSFSFADVGATRSSRLFWRNLEALCGNYFLACCLFGAPFCPGLGPPPAPLATHQQAAGYALARPHWRGEQFSRNHCAQPGRPLRGVVE